MGITASVIKADGPTADARAIKGDIMARKPRAAKNIIRDLLSRAIIRNILSRAIISDVSSRAIIRDVSSHAIIRDVFKNILRVRTSANHRQVGDGQYNF